MSAMTLAEHDRVPALRPDKAMLARLRKAVGDDGPEAMEHVLRVAAQVARARAVAQTAGRRA